jgi:hypothetical protein
MQNSIYKIKYVISVLGFGGVVFDWEAWCLTGRRGVWLSLGVISPAPERNTVWNRGRKFFHCLGAPNNLIRPWLYRVLFVGKCVLYCCHREIGTLSHSNEVFPCFFLSCKANTRIYPAKMGHGPRFPIFFLLFLCYVQVQVWQEEYSVKRNT